MNEFKLPNAAAYKITVTGTAARLLDLINAAASATVPFPSDLNMVEITPEDGNVRFTTGDASPTASNGNLILDDDTKEIECAPVDMKLISTSGSVVCNVRLGWKTKDRR